MRLVIGLGVCGLLYGSVWAQAQGTAATQVQRFTEAEAVARLMAGDPRVRALSARIDEVRAIQAERARWPNPVASYARESVANVTDVFLVARQELSVSGRRGQLRTAGRIAVEAAEADSRFQVIQLQADFRQAFTTLLHAQEREVALRSGIEALQKLIEVLRAREEAGEGSSYDRMRGQRALVDLEADLASAAIARAQAQGQLAGHLGPNVIPAALVAADQLDPSTPTPPVEMLVEQALTNRADYRATELATKQFEAERLAAARLRVPTPTVSGGLKRSRTVDVTSAGYLFSLDVALPLFNRGQSAVALASAQAARAEAETASSRIRIEADVRSAHAALAIQQERATRYRRSAADTAEPLARIGRVGYEEGELGILELLDADSQALDARLRVLDLAAAARRAAIELDRAIGREFRP